MTPLEHALAYAARGWRVAPIPPGQQYPRIAQWQIKATTDPAVIRTWWARFGGDGVSIVTGAVSRLVVVDVDPRHDGDETLADLERTHGALPDTVESVTGRGGRHLYFRMPDGLDYPRNDQAGIVLGAGLDVRGEGGQVVAPPSVHAISGIAYEWEVEHSPLDGVAVAEAPAWLVGLLTMPAALPRPRQQRGPAPTGDRPGDLFNAAHTWPELLEPVGWQMHSAHAHAGGYELWTRPGKSPREGASASLYYQGSDVLKVFTTSAAPLEPGRTYDRWGFHVATKHGGDFEAGASVYRKGLNTAAAAAAAAAANSTPDIPADIPPPRRPAIFHNGRQLDVVVAESIDALAKANEPPVLFVRSGELARVRDDEGGRPIVESLGPEHVRLHLADAATWWRSSKDHNTATYPPLEVAASVRRSGSWPLPALAGVVELPVVRPDGTFATEHGYDAATKLYHWHRGTEYPPIPHSPSADELAAAVALVDEALCDFPWDTSADRANAWGLLVTPLVRAIIGQVPMALVDAPEPGTGKGLLVSVVTIVASGRTGALMAWPASDEELEKKVTAVLMAGATNVTFDNVEGMIRSATLAAVLTSDTWSGRILGRSEIVNAPVRATWMATGNNVEVGGDLARRCYRIRLDARMASPWKRSEFRHPDLVGWVGEHRSDLIHALCTIVRSWWVAGQPKADALAAMGGYTSWVRTVGGILEHAGIGDFLGNLDAFHAEADRESQAWASFLAVWSEQYGEQPRTVGELVLHMDGESMSGRELKEAIPEDLAAYFGTPGFSRRLSLALRKRVRRHFGDDGLHLVDMPRDNRKVAIYSVTDRSMALFDQTPAIEGASTRTDAKGAGVAGVVPLKEPQEVDIHSSVDSSGIPDPHQAEPLPRLPNSRAPIENPF